MVLYCVMLTGKTTLLFLYYLMRFVKFLKFVKTAHRDDTSKKQRRYVKEERVFAHYQLLTFNIALKVSKNNLS